MINKNEKGDVSRRDFLVGAGSVIAASTIGGGLLAGCAGKEVTKTVEITKTIQATKTVQVPTTITASGTTVTSTAPGTTMTITKTAVADGEGPVAR
ncbi:MAG: hypothetical protein PHF74_05415, partial [Dehalococcoidales bacterium]|nr:hypothetical protein [Dehalococcoidales bacterium]